MIDIILYTIIVSCKVYISSVLGIILSVSVYVMFYHVEGACYGESGGD